MTNELGPFLIGLTGHALSSDDLRRIENPAVGGFILFSRNFQDRDQLARLTKEIRANSPLPKPIFVDHEGGRVQRFRTGFTAIPAMGKLGAIAKDDEGRALLLARQAGFVLAAELKACGVDMSFAPVLDLDWGHSDVIGDRSLGKDAGRVSHLSSALMHGFLLAGMQACGKHFPGHGWVKLDSHIALPRDTRPFNEIMQDDVLPYRHNSSLSMASIMPAHVVFSEVDDKPACFSKFWLQDILRGELGFDGAIVSDDLDMVGAHGEGDICQRASSALKAGCDAVLVCNQFDDIDTLLANPIAEIKQNTVERTRRLKRLLASGPKLSWESLEALVDYQLAVEQISNL